VQKLSNENEFHLHENEPVGGTHFDVNGFECRLVSVANVMKNASEQKTVE